MAPGFIQTKPSQALTPKANESICPLWLIPRTATACVTSHESFTRAMLRGMRTGVSEQTQTSPRPLSLVWHNFHPD